MGGVGAGGVGAASVAATVVVVSTTGRQQYSSAALAIAQLGLVRIGSIEFSNARLDRTTCLPLDEFKIRNWNYQTVTKGTLGHHTHGRRRSGRRHCHGHRHGCRLGLVSVIAALEDTSLGGCNFSTRVDSEDAFALVGCSYGANHGGEEDDGLDLHGGDDQSRIPRYVC